MELKEAVVKAKIDPGLKSDAEAVLEELGMNTTEAIRIYFKQIQLHKGLPFAVRLPNQTTQNAIEELESGDGEIFHSAEDLMADLNS